MAKASKFGDRSHARFYGYWKRLPAWQALSNNARVLLLEIVWEIRPDPGNNGELEWPCRKAAKAIGVSPATAARALNDLECKGWLTVEKCANFGRRTTPARYAFTGAANAVTCLPASNAFEKWKPESPMPQPSPAVLKKAASHMTRL